VAAQNHMIRCRCTSRCMYSSMLYVVFNTYRFIFIYYMFICIMFVTRMYIYLGFIYVHMYYVCDKLYLFKPVHVFVLFVSAHLLQNHSKNTSKKGEISPRFMLM
jgi:hypothetical protein